MKDDMRCCVIGGGGFIGKHLVAALLKAGRQVVVIDRGGSLPGFESQIEFHSGDYGQKDFLRSVLSTVDEVIDLAYASVPKTSFDNPAADLISNIPPALGLFEVAAELGLKKVIVISSGGTVYGHSDGQPIQEDHPTNPISPYGITKLAIEKYAGMFFALKQLPVIIVRPGNAYGEGQRPFTGQGLIATLVASIQTGKEVTLFGETEIVRDYIHVVDIANGIVAALTKGKPGQIYNLGTGVGTTNKEILDTLKVFADQDRMKIRLKIEPVRTFDVGANILNSTKMTTETGWSPTIKLVDGLKRVWEKSLQSHDKRD